MTIHKEGYPTLLYGFVMLLFINFIVNYYITSFFPIFLFISLTLYLFTISFFRKPDRAIMPHDDHIILSPCDGKVVVIEKVFEPEYLKEECVQVSIFMSPLNVHINWYPSDSEVLYSKYHPGKYLAAWNPKASTENERTTICYSTKDKKVLLRQVAGALARRIVCYANVGDIKKQGEELGFIKFGSRVDLYLPLDTKLEVNIGDKVKGKITQIAHF